MYQVCFQSHASCSDIYMFSYLLTQLYLVECWIIIEQAGCCSWDNWKQFWYYGVHGWTAWWHTRSLLPQSSGTRKHMLKYQLNHCIHSLMLSAVPTVTTADKLLIKFTRKTMYRLVKLMGVVIRTKQHQMLLMDETWATRLPQRNKRQATLLIHQRTTLRKRWMTLVKVLLMAEHSLTLWPCSEE